MLRGKDVDNQVVLTIESAAQRGLAIGPIDGLELLVIEAGLLLEKHHLEQRLRDMAEHQRTS